MNFGNFAEGKWQECQATSESLQKREWNTIETKIRRVDFKLTDSKFVHSKGD